MKVDFVVRCELLKAGCDDLSCPVQNKYSFDFVNCIQCEAYKPKAKATHLLYLRKQDKQTHTQKRNNKINVGHIKKSDVQAQKQKIGKEIAK